MIKKITTLLLVSISLTVFGQKLDNSTLWKISGNGLEQPSYLFGTIHLTCDATLAQKVKDALDKTSQVVLEIDMDDPMMQAKMMKGMRMADNKSIKDFVTDEEYKAIDSLFIKNMGMSVNMLQNVKPTLLSSMLIPRLLDCPTESFELELIKVAKEQKEEVIGLETIEYQLEIFDQIPYKDQVKELLRSSKDNLTYDKSVIKLMLDVYKTENITRMLNMMDEDDVSIMSKYQDIMLDKRNKNWIPRIEALAKEKPSFFGVGAAHLAGKNGVINLLREAGFTVKAVK